MIPNRLMRIALLLLLASCKAKDPFTTGFTGVVEPPGGLRYGMSRSEVLKAFPKLAQDQVTISSSVVLSVQLDHDKLTHVWAHLDAHDVSQATLERDFGALWGPPHKIEGHLGGDNGWSSAATGWHAILACPISTDCMGLQFEAFRPLTASYFGKTIAAPAVFAKLALGMTVDQARAAVPELSAPQSIGDHLTVGHFDGGADDVSAIVYFDHDKLAIFALGLPLLADAEKLLTTTWGPPAAPRVWKSADWRAELVPVESHPSSGGTVTAAELRLTKP